MNLIIDFFRPLIVVSVTIPVNLCIFSGIFVSTIFRKRLLRYRLAQYSAKLLLFLSGLRIQRIQKFGEENSSNAYYLGNFIGIEILPALISIIKEPTCLILRWFNFFTPVFGWAFIFLKFIPFTKHYSKFSKILKRRVQTEGYSVVNFPAGYNILHKADSRYLFKSVCLKPFDSKIKIVPFAIIETDIRHSFWFRSCYTISFLPSIYLNSEIPKIDQISHIERVVRVELGRLTEQLGA